MAKVLLTEEQRIQNRCEARSRLIADGLAAFKNRYHLTNMNIGSEVGLSHSAIAKVLDGEDVRIHSMALMRLIEIAGLELRPRKKDGADD